MAPPAERRAGSVLTTLVRRSRDVQDGVLRTRLDTTRVPEWFYNRFRDDDERDFGDTAEGHRLRLAKNPPSPT